MVVLFFTGGVVAAAAVVAFQLYRTYPKRAPVAIYSYIRNGSFMMNVSGDDLVVIPDDVKPYLITLDIGAVLPSNSTAEEVQIIRDQIRLIYIIESSKFWRDWFKPEVAERTKRIEKDRKGVLFQP
jgi:hypothetical protein